MSSWELPQGINWGYIQDKNDLCKIGFYLVVTGFPIKPDNIPTNPFEALISAVIALI
jgi:hypothetical protein